MNNPQRYTKVAIILHWLIALMIFGMFAVGWFMADLPKDAPKVASFDLFDLGLYMVQLPEAISPRSYYFNLHKSFGVMVLALVLFRIYWKLTHKAPALPASIIGWQRKAASASHHLLYMLMFLMPASGLIMATYSKYGVKWFGIPLIKGLDNEPLREVFKSAHEAIAVILISLIAIHVLAALKHKFVDKDEVMGRMTSCD
ncbi:MAG: cytochrome b [Methylophilaceae bacterium]